MSSPGRNTILVTHDGGATCVSAASATRWEITAPSSSAGDIPNRSFRRGAMSGPGWRPIQPLRYDNAVSGGQAALVRLRRNRVPRRYRAAGAWTPGVGNVDTLVGADVMMIIGSNRRSSPFTTVYSSADGLIPAPACSGG